MALTIPKPALLDLRDRLRATMRSSQELDARVLCTLVAPLGSTVAQSRINGRWCVYRPMTGTPSRPWLWEDDFWSREERGPTTSWDGATALAALRDLAWMKGFDGSIRVRPLHDQQGMTFRYPNLEAGSSLGMPFLTFQMTLVDAIISAEIARHESTTKG